VVGVKRQLDRRFLGQVFTFWTGLDTGSAFEGVEAFPEALEAASVELGPFDDVTLELAGAHLRRAEGGHADAVSAGASVEFVAWALEQVERGARGRALRRAAQVYVTAASDERVALDRFRRQLAVALRGEHHRRNLELAGSSMDQAAVWQMVSQEDWTRLPALVPDEVVRRLKKLQHVIDAKLIKL